MLLTTKWFGKYVCPVVICTNFDYLKEPLSDLIFEMMPLEGDVFCAHLGAFAVR